MSNTCHTWIGQGFGWREVYLSFCMPSGSWEEGGRKSHGSHTPLLPPATWGRTDLEMPATTLHRICWYLLCCLHSLSTHCLYIYIWPCHACYTLPCTALHCLHTAPLYVCTLHHYIPVSLLPTCLPYHLLPAWEEGGGGPGGRSVIIPACLAALPSLSTRERTVSNENGKC